MKIHNLIMGIFSLLAIAGNIHAASYDCSKASTGVERMICADPELSKLDEDLNVKYKAHLRKSADPDLVKKKQRRWLLRRNSCSTVECVKLRYAYRIDDLTERERELAELRSKLEIPEYSKDNNCAFCTRLLEGLKLWKDVTILAPIAAADAIDDQTLGRYFAKCNPRKFIKSCQISPRVWNEMNLDSLSREEREAFGEHFIMTKGFRLYRANIDNDPSNHEELILYGAGTIHDGSESDPDSDIDLTDFNVIDTQHCRISATAQVQDVVNRPNGSFVGLMKFENKTYVFDGKYYPMESLWGINIQVLEPSRSYFGNVCHFVARD